MKKMLVGIGALVLVASMAMAETDPIAMEAIRAIQKGKNTRDQIETLRISGNGTIGGTLAVTGVATFTAESVHNGGIDADYITTDAAAGIDTKTAGTLMVGASTATKVEVADTGVETEIQGTMDVQEAATLASATVTGDITANGNIVGDANTVITNMATMYLSGGLVMKAGTSISVEGTQAGMTTNINVIVAGNTTSQLAFVDGVLVGYTPL